MLVQQPVINVAIYSRVSTANQDDNAQHDELCELVARSGWRLVRSYREVVSGTKGPDARPELKQLLTDAKLRHFTKIIVWSADRLARSIKHLIDVLGELRACQVDVFSYRQGVDTATPMGSMLWQVLGIFAEFENQIRQERQALGISRAREKGVRFGRPSSPSAKLQQIRSLRQSGYTMATIAAAAGVGIGTVAQTLTGADSSGETSKVVMDLSTPRR